jgi:AcrR family transcriptional regulator
MEKDSIICRIVVTAGRLFRTKGFDKTSLQDLLEELKMSDTLFFKYFQSMDELLEVVWSESLRIRQKEEKKLSIPQGVCSLREGTTGQPCGMS